MTDLALRPIAPPDPPAPAAPGPVRTPLDHWLAEQQELSAVERFSQHHDHGGAPDGHDGLGLGLGPPTLHATVWQDLVPLTLPRPGEQYRFEVDLDACTGCKACVAACHSLNGLDEGESFRTVGTLHGFDPGNGLALVQTVTTACHHCVEPACMLGCPTQAYEKDPVTGIVRHLDDQCIGCSYCTLTCPYEVPRFNERLGIVRKCDLCQDRLAVGEAPACVQGCPTSAITVGIVPVADVVGALVASRDTPAGEATLVPSAPSSALSTPTTVYRRRSPFPADPIMVPADRNTAHPAHAHTPLAVMLVLTQLAVGIAVAGVALPPTPAVAVATLVAGAVALGASLLHLGRPTLAWKAVLGLRTSWLSREILAFGAFAGVAALWSVASLLGAPADAPASDPSPVARGLGIATAAVGVVGVVCSALIYSVTGRRWWAWWRTLARFAATTLTFAALAAVVFGTTAHARRGATLAIASVTAVLVAELVLVFRPHPRSGQLTRTARLLRHELGTVWRGRVWAGVATISCAAAAWTDGAGSRTIGIAWGVLAAGAALAGALCERWLFFRASSPRRMPGAVP